VILFSSIKIYTAWFKSWRSY